MTKKRRGLTFFAIVIFIFSILNSLGFIRITFLLFFLFNACLFLSINWASKYHTSRWDIVPVSILLVVIVLNFYMPPHAWTKIQFAFTQEKRCEVIQLVEMDKLETEANDLVDLPDEYKNLSDSGTIYINENDKEESTIGFWINRGMLNSGYSMLVYVSSGKINDIEVPYGTSNVELVQLDKNWFYLRGE